MTKLLAHVFEELMTLPDAQQAEAAALMIEFLDKRRAVVHLDDDTRAAVREGMAQAERGEFASAEEVAAIFARYRG